MAWNEPGGGRDNDPWGGRGGDQGPPDLDEAFRKLQGRLSGIFGGGGGSGGGDGGKPQSILPIIAIGLFVAALLWAGTGFYQVDQQERVVIFRFGKLLDEVVQPGLRWNPPLIDERNFVNVTRVSSHEHEGQMLTENENWVDVSLAVQYVVQNPRDFVVEVANPTTSLEQATESALRHVVGSSVMNDVITDGREAIALEVQERLQGYLDRYGTGIGVSKVNIRGAGPPPQVQESFDDVQKAKEDEQRVINQSNAYAQQIIPEARGEAQKQIEQSNAYRDQIIARAQGEASRFEKLLTEYSAAKQVTRDRLYIEAMEDVLRNTTKVLIDVEGGNNMMYLPLDQLTKDSGGSNPAGGRTNIERRPMSDSTLNRSSGTTRSSGRREGRS